MSCFMHKDATFEKVESGLKKCLRDGKHTYLDSCFTWHISDLLRMKNINLYQFIDDLIKDAYRLNQLAYFCRYKEGDSTKIDFDKKSQETPNAVQTLKYLQSIEYQCVDAKGEGYPAQDWVGDVIDNLKETISAMKNYIISNMDEYSDAKWC